MLFEGIDEARRLGDPAELVPDEDHGRFVIDAANTRLGRAILQKQAAVIPERGVAQSGFDANAGGAAGEDEVSDPALPEDGITVNDLTQVTFFATVGFPVYAPRTFIGRRSLRRSLHMRTAMRAVAT